MEQQQQQHYDMLLLLLLLLYIYIYIYIYKRHGQIRSTRDLSKDDRRINAPLQKKDAVGTHNIAAFFSSSQTTSTKPYGAPRHCLVVYVSSP
jgi:hypothetical protein